MKTTSDIAAFLKRTNAVLTLSYDGAKFLAHVKGDECASKYLDDALENLAEAARRRANQMAPMRDTKPEARAIAGGTGGGGGGGVIVTSTAPKVPFTNLPSISQAAQNAYQASKAGVTCPQCGLYPAASYPGTHLCINGHSWKP